MASFDSIFSIECCLFDWLFCCLSAQHRVKPGPDPTRPEEETKWLPMSGIDEEVMKPSYSWIEAGTGRLGKIYLEILKCDDLPNTRSITGSTDPCCCIIFEDAIVKSNVIENELSPRCKLVVIVTSKDSK